MYGIIYQMISLLGRGVYTGASIYFYWMVVPILGDKPCRFNCNLESFSIASYANSYSFIARSYRTTYFKLLRNRHILACNDLFWAQACKPLAIMPCSEICWHSAPSIFENNKMFYGNTMRLYVFLICCTYIPLITISIRMFSKKVIPINNCISLPHWLTHSLTH